MATKDTPTSALEQSGGSEPSLGPTLLALGTAVISWSYLERAVDLLFGTLLGRLGLHTRSADLIAQNVEVREKAKIVVALACDARLPAGELERTIALMNAVQNDLRNERNRLFHDSWSYKEGAVARRKTTGSRIVRPQSRKVELLLPMPKAVEPGEITAFLARCDAISDEIISVGERLIEAMPTDKSGLSREQSLGRQTFWSRLLRYWR